MAETDVVVTDNPVDPVITPEPTTPEPYDWHKDIDPSVANDPVWKSTPDVKTLTKAYADAVKYNVGAVKLPGKDATPEEVDSFHRKLGRPESAEGYQLTERLQTDPIAASMRGVAHAAGLTPKQWETITEGWTRLNGEQAKVQEAKASETTQALKQEWGAAYEQKLGLTQRLIKTFGDDETWTEIASSPQWGNSPKIITMMSKIAAALAEEELIPIGGETTQSMDDMKSQLEEVTNSREYLDTKHPMHSQAVERATKLFQVVYS